MHTITRQSSWFLVQRCSCYPHFYRYCRCSCKKLSGQLNPWQLDSRPILLISVQCDLGVTEREREGGRMREREREKTSIYWFTSRMATKAGAEPGPALELAPPWQPRCCSPSLLLSFSQHHGLLCLRTSVLTAVSSMPRASSHSLASAVCVLALVVSVAFPMA